MRAGAEFFLPLTAALFGAGPVFTGNRSAQFEARFALVEVVESPSILFRGMAGSRIPIATAHGEGFASFASPADRERALTALRERPTLLLLP